MSEKILKNKSILFFFVTFFVSLFFAIPLNRSMAAVTATTSASNFHQIINGDDTITITGTAFSTDALISDIAYQINTSVGAWTSTTLLTSSYTNEIDSTFDLSGTNGTIYSTAIQDDGKIIVGGSFTKYNGIIVNNIARLNTDGTIDSTFNLHGSGVNDVIRSIKIQQDGKILIAGSFSSYNEIPVNRIARLNTDGTLDTSFNIEASSANDTVYSIAIQDNGKILIGGSFTDYNSVTSGRIARLNTDGTLDASFNFELSGANDTVYSIAIQGDGKILIGGSFTDYNSVTSGRIARLNTDGTLDASFNFELSGANDTVYSIAIQGDGKILIGGGFVEYNTVAINRIACLNTDGTLDGDFNVDGSGADDLVYSIAIQGDGKILIGGGFINYNKEKANHVTRLNANGSFDSTFSVITAETDIVYSISIQQNRRIILGGVLTLYNTEEISNILRVYDLYQSDFSITTSTLRLEQVAGNLIYFKITDENGNTKESDYDNFTFYTVDRVPTINNFIINSGDSYTESATTTLTISVIDEVTPASSLQMKISNNSDFSGASWENYTTNKSWIISGTQGSNTVYFSVKDEVGNISSTNDSIIFDNIAPTILELSNDSTPRKSKVWRWEANETATYRYVVTTTPSFVFTNESYSSTKSTSVTTNGLHYLYVQAKDSFGHLSSVVKVYATVDNSLSESNVLIDNGAWCWFADPRAVRHHGTYDKLYIGLVDKDGNIKIESYNYDTNTFNTFTLHPNLQIDDHDNPSIFIRNDGRLQIFYSKHSATGDAMYYRISTNPEDISSWGVEQTTGVNTPGSYGYTYPVPMQLSAENNMMYLFWRGGDMQSAFATSTNGTSWNAAHKLIIADGSRDNGYAPYIKYASNNIDEIHFAYSNNAPSLSVTSSIYYAYYKNGNFYKADGTLIKNVNTLPLQKTDMDLVYDGASGNPGSWIWDIALDNSGKPVIVYTTFPGAPDNNYEDHRYRYAYWNGTSWIDNEITSSIGSMAEDSLGATYSGGIVINHSNPNIVYLSKKVSGQFEIQKWTTSDHGETWISESITSNSNYKNVRPFLPYGSTSDNDLLWMSGRYYYYEDYDMDIMMLSTSTIVSDAISPIGSIIINNNNIQTNLSSVTLTLSASDNISSASGISMMVSNNASFTGASWESYATSKEWTLSGTTNGTKTVYIKFRDEALNESATYSDTIEYITYSGGGGSTYTPPIIVIPEVPVITSSSTPTTTITIPVVPPITTQTILFKYSNDPKVYILENGIRHWIKDEYTFNKLGYNWNDIQILNSDNNYQIGTDLEVIPTQFVFTKTLKSRSIGTDVKELQTLLKKLGFFTYKTITNFFGTQTYNAVIKFQKANKLKVTGIVDMNTRGVLNGLLVY